MSSILLLLFLSDLSAAECVELFILTCIAMEIMNNNNNK